MVKRIAQSEITRLLEEFPAVGILGPRQVGKTTLAEEISKSLLIAVFGKDIGQGNF